MFNWFTNRIIDGYIKGKIKQIKELDLKKFILNYLKKHKDEIIQKVKEVFDKFVDNLIKQIIEKYEEET